MNDFLVFPRRVRAGSETLWIFRGLSPPSAHQRGNILYFFVFKFRLDSSFFSSSSPLYPFMLVLFISFHETTGNPLRITLPCLFKKRYITDSWIKKTSQYGRRPTTIVHPFNTHKKTTHYWHLKNRLNIAHTQIPLSNWLRWSRWRTPMLKHKNIFDSENFAVTWTWMNIRVMRLGSCYFFALNSNSILLRDHGQ